ncbi:MAG: hypothetical protein BGO11_16825 [Solirubrobacterales bacterium 70-9]|nr:MAG: hypothetical protein BGO11_16825 [Solirubrobacterales bacterium 70-9]
MSVVWVSTREWKVPPIPGVTVFKSQFYIYRPGEKAEVRLGSDSENPDAETTWYLKVLQEVGTEGWECIGETVMDTALITEEHGWKSKEVPVHIRWLFKRPSS